MGMTQRQKKKKKKFENYDSFLMQHFNYNSFRDRMNNSEYDGDEGNEDENVSLYMSEDEIEGKHDDINGCDEEEFVVDEVDEVAIADPNNDHFGISKLHKKQPFVDRHQLNEGQYSVQYSDDSEKDGKSEVVFSALMPNDDKLSNDDVDCLLDNIENILSDINLTQSDHHNDDEDNDKMLKVSAVSSSDDCHNISDGSYSGPDDPILASINNTVLKMCGIRNAKHRQFIMFHIEKLMNVKTVNEMIEVEDDDDDKINDEDEENEEEIPPEFLCPITHQIMTDPVLISDGHSYERVAIENWLIKHDKSPMTNSVLGTKQIFPNHSLRSMIAEYQINKQQKK